MKIIARIDLNENNKVALILSLSWLATKRSRYFYYSEFSVNGKCARYVVPKRGVADGFAQNDESGA